MNEPDQYYAVCFRFEHKEYFLIWISSDIDRLVLSTEKKLAVFSSIEELIMFAEQSDFLVHSEVTPLYDFDALADWTKVPDPNKIDCKIFLDAWNMSGDIEKSFGRKLEEPDESSAVYDKLFYGNNLSSITPQGEHYIPQCSKDEVTCIVSVFEEGLNTLLDSIERAI